MARSILTDLLLAGVLKMGAVSAGRVGQLQLEDATAARQSWSTAAVRSWSAGTTSTGTWTLRDETTGADRVTVDSLGNLAVMGELRTTSTNAVRMVAGNYGAFFRNDGSSFWLLFTASADQYGTFNSLRPFSVNLANGLVTMANGLDVTAGGVSITGGVGLDFGTQVATGTDLSKHLALYGNAYGFNIINNTLQAIASGKVFQFDSVAGDFIAPSGGSIIGSTKVGLGTASATFASSNLNRVAEKNNTTAVTWTLPAGLGANGDSIPVVNSGTAGAITVARATGVALVMDGVDANVTVAPGSCRTLYRTATTDKWMVL